MCASDHGEKVRGLSTNLPTNVGVSSGGVEVCATLEKSVKLPYEEAHCDYWLRWVSEMNHNLSGRGR